MYTIYIYIYYYMGSRTFISGPREKQPLNHMIPLYLLYMFVVFHLQQTNPLQTNQSLANKSILNLLHNVEQNISDRLQSMSTCDSRG